MRAEDRRIVEREIANPKPFDQLVGQVRDQETADEFYLASRAAIDGETEQNRPSSSSASRSRMSEFLSLRPEGSSMIGAILGLTARPLLESLMHLASGLRQDALSLLRSWISRRWD